MDNVEPGLFDLLRLEPEPQPSPMRTRRGRNRETWSRTVTAAVTAALTQYLEDTVVVDAFSGGVIEDPASEEAGPDPALPALEQLPWLLWPTDGLEELLEGGALTVLEVASAVTPEAPDRGTFTWTVTVKLTDVQCLRQLATRAHPADADLIADDLAVAWQRAADPFAPLRSIPGISWRPLSVEVERGRPGQQGRRRREPPPHPGPRATHSAGLAGSALDGARPVAEGVARPPHCHRVVTPAHVFLGDPRQNSAFATTHRGAPSSAERVRPVVTCRLPQHR